MKIQTDPVCSACDEEDETSVHFLGKCPTTHHYDGQTFHSRISFLEVRQTSLHPATDSQRGSHNLTLFRGCALGQSCYGLSAGWPECKVRYLCQGGYVIIVCMSVCLLAVHKNVQMDLHEIFREGWQWVNEQTIKFWWRSGSRIRIRIVTLVKRALAEVCTVPVLLVYYYI